VCPTSFPSRNTVRLTGAPFQSGVKESVKKVGTSDEDIVDIPGLCSARMRFLVAKTLLAISSESP